MIHFASNYPVIFPSDYLCTGWMIPQLKFTERIHQGLLNSNDKLKFMKFLETPKNFNHHNSVLKRKRIPFTTKHQMRCRLCSRVVRFVPEGDKRSLKLVSCLEAAEIGMSHGLWRHIFTRGVPQEGGLSVKTGCHRDGPIRPERHENGNGIQNSTSPRN